MSVLKVALCLLAIGLVVAEVVPTETNDAEDVEGEAEETLESDTPTRQAQRAMLAERETATAAHRDEDVLSMRMMQVEEGADATAEKRKKKKSPASRGRRVSGAARSFLPNDKMCVMCQFLTERISLDLIGHANPSIANPYGGYHYGSDGNPPMAMIGAVAPAGKGGDSFLEVTEEDEEADEEGEEEADELETEEADEVEAEEEESEDLALLQISEEEEEETEDESEDESEEEADEEAEDESEEEASISDETEEEAASEWTTPLYAMAETAATTSTASDSEENGDYQTPQYVDGVYQNTAEEVTEEDQAETDAGTADLSEPTFFESQATVNTADDTEWTTPEYSSDKAEAPIAEATAFLEVGQSQGWTTPTYSDSAVESTGKKEYARILTTEEEEEEETESSLIEQAAESEVKFFSPRIIRSRGGRGNVRVVFHTPRRYRASDAIVPRPRWNRHGHHTPHRAMAHITGGAQFRMAEHAAYDRLETYCSTRLPEVYGRYCRPILRNFRHITEGLRYGDRVGQVCMQVNLCKKTSYIAKSPHVRHGVW
jgi:hypothetical protein